jgi:hypothetical protein
MKQTDFIVKLQAEAKLQAKLEQQRVLPKSLDFLTNFIAKYTWQVILFLSFITALILEKL